MSPPTKKTAQVKKGKPGHASEGGFPAPRLSKALLETRAGRYDAFKTKVELSKRDPITLGEKTFDKDLADLLDHIRERIDKGLDEPWLLEHGYGYNFGDQPDVPAKTLSRLKGESKPTESETSQACMDDFFLEPEEKWARAFTETFIFLSYHLPDITYSNKGGMDGVYRGFPRAFPLAVECQQLATYCILSRGFDYKDVSVQKEDGTTKLAGCSCSATSTALPVFEHHETFECGAKYTTTDAYLKIKPPPTPGSTLVFNPGGPTYTGQDKSEKGKVTHTASVLRISGARVQFIDTGVVSGNGEPSGEGGTVDHAFCKGAIPSTNTLVGVGILPKADPGKLAAMTTSMLASRPLGLLRLIIADTTNPSKMVVRFVSKMLVMRHPVSKLIWSLRGLPVAGLTAFWYVYAPQGHDGSKDKKPAAPGKKWGDALIDDGDKSKPTAMFVAGWGKLIQTNVIRGEATGRARVYRHKKNGYLQDFSANEPTDHFAERGVNSALGTLGKLGAWCEKSDNFGLMYVCKSGDAGTADTSAAPVAFFEP
jgi:hypothetical protein